MHFLPLAARADAARPRLAAIDWAMFETAAALGHMPVAMCELIRYREDAVEPVIPADVTDLGLRGSPNYELLQLVRPDLILTSPFYAQHRARFETIAPVLSLPFYTPGTPPLAPAFDALDAMADALNDPGAALRARAAAEAEIAALIPRLAPFNDRPVCLIDIGDARHIRSFGFDSMFGDMLLRLGLTNGWTDPTQFSFRAPLPLERLADVPDARVVIVGPIPVEAREGIARSVLWNALPAVAENRVYQLETVNAFGGIPAGLRFARLLTQAFETGPIA